MDLTPIGDKVIVEVADAEEQTASGIVLPDNAQERPQQGKVAAVGPGRRLKNGTVVAPSVKAGDRVLFAKYLGNEITFKETELLIVESNELLGIIS